MSEMHRLHRQEDGCLMEFLTPSMNPSNYNDGRRSIQHNVQATESSLPQLTLFYGGTVNVYNNVPFEKHTVHCVHIPPPVCDYEGSYVIPSIPTVDKIIDLQHDAANEIISFVLANSEKCHLGSGWARETEEIGSAVEIPCQALVPKALPLAMKASLVRFLEMRMARIRSMAPYLVRGHGGLPYNTMRRCSVKENVGSNYGTSSNYSESDEMNQDWVFMNDAALSPPSECESAC